LSRGDLTQAEWRVLKALLHIEPENRGGKGGLIDGLLAARGAGSPVSFTAWLTSSDDRSPSIPGRSNRRVKIEHDRTLYKQRNRIERMFGHLKINRAIATRYDQLVSSFPGIVHLATARYWLKFVHAA